MPSSNNGRAATRRLLPPLAACIAVIGQAASAAPAAASVGVPVDEFTARRSEGKFLNPEGTPKAPVTWRDGLSLWYKLATSKNPVAPAGHTLDEAQAMAMLEQHGAVDSLTWLGHASFLIRVGGKTVLTDPYLTDYASPIDGIGPKRFAGPGIAIERLPKIDVVLVSHNHYDHLDLRALARLPGKEAVQVVVPTGMAAPIRALGYADVKELTWGESLEVASLKVHGVPAIHFSGRGLFDRNETLWAGFVIETPKRKLYFAGDTGYHAAVFKAIGERHGPFDLALLPIGAYEPRKMMSEVHVVPEEAVAIGRDVKAKAMVGMHWGTIALALEDPFEPPLRFRQAGRDAGYADDALWVMAIGETRPIAPAPALP